MTRIATLLVACTLVFGFAACGGDDDDTSATASAEDPTAFCSALDASKDGWVDDTRRAFAESAPSSAPAVLADETTVLVAGVLARLDGAPLPDEAAFAESYETAFDHCVGEGLIMLSREGDAIKTNGLKG